MSIFRFIRDEFIEVIDWVENNKNVISWKFPDRDCNIKYGASLTVRESQTALFLNEGQFADEFSPGFYQLNTENLPFITSLQNWESGFKSPFKADVYFFSRKQFTNLKWGTISPVIMEDPKFNNVRIRAFGTYHLKITDCKKFFKQYAGNSPRVMLGELEDSFRNIISSKFSEHIAESGVSVLEMVQNYSEFGEALSTILQTQFAEFGVEISSFHIGGISLPDQVQEFYDKLTNMNMVNDMDKFERFQKAVSLEEAAKNDGAAGQSVGIILGSDIAGGVNSSQKSDQKNEQSKEEILATLKELGQLKESGVLTKTEFDTKKKELLARL